eukprot:97332-Prymnesium_polylepis.1
MSNVVDLGDQKLGPISFGIVGFVFVVLCVPGVDGCLLFGVCTVLIAVDFANLAVAGTIL